ncbi:hypothetical protein M422DRAFT_183500 [Sphaerobolus stellatus SS14]|uniref:Uncharacterized protein n=1 Tax=Sphaerobolus stellatus (strain SS14) TaxID=990650 RepID=A0A0C9V7E5_SPHS4|nr:hypothetical protein M422DRAFT_183500 [Sphaerobolus stellatus SS14]
MIVLVSLPPNWDMMVATLYEAKTSAEVVQRVSMHWTHISRGRSVSANTTVLQTDAKKPREMAVHKL